MFWWKGRGGAGVAINRTGGAGSVGGEKQGAQVQVWAQVQKGGQEKKMQTKKKKKEKKIEKTGGKGKKELMQVGVPKIAPTKTRIAQGRRRTSRGQWSERSTEDARRGS